MILTTFVLDFLGVVISFPYSTTSKTLHRRLWSRLSNYLLKNSFTPVIYFPDLELTCVIMKEKNILLGCLVTNNSNIFLILTYLMKLKQLLSQTLQRLDRNRLMDNIPFINELFEECLDYGIPQSFSDLKMFLELELDLPDVVQPKYTPPPLLWNLPSIKYRKNELFITIDEKITLRRYSGQLISSKIDGLVNMRLFLSDYPNIEVEVADYMLSSPYFNCQYHHPLSNLSFLPIDEDMKVSFNQACKIKSTIPFVIFLDTKYCQDQFDVMSYQITQYSDHIEGLFSCQLTMNSRNSYSFNVKSLYFSLKNVILTFPFTSDDTVERITIQKNPGNGNPRWCPENDTIEWIIPTMHVNKEYVVSLVIHRCKSGWNSGRMGNASRMFSDCMSQFTIPSHLISNRMKIERVQLIKTPPSYSFMIYYQINTIAKEYHIPALFSKSFSQEVDDVMCQDELTIHLEKDYKKIPN